MSGIYGQKLLNAANVWIAINAAPFANNATINVRAANQTGSPVTYWMAILPSGTPPTGTLPQVGVLTPGITILPNFMYEDTGKCVSSGYNVYCLVSAANAVSIQVDGIDI